MRNAIFLSNFKVTVIMSSCFIDVSTEGIVSDGAFITAIVLILLAIFFMRLGFAAEAREKRCCKIHKPQANTVKSGRKVG